MAVRRRSFGSDPDGEWGIEYNDQNGRISGVYSTFSVPRPAFVVMTGGQVASGTLHASSPINVPGTTARYTAPPNEDITGINSFGVGGG